MKATKQQEPSADEGGELPADRDLLLTDDMDLADLFHFDQAPTPAGPVSTDQAAKPIEDQHDGDRSHH